jgi:ribosomal protein S18 acetylase RimI-like enzyme
MKIEIIQPNDWEEIRELFVRAGLVLSDLETEEQEFKDMISRNPFSCFKAVEQNKIIGTVFGTWNGRRAWIYRLAVDPAFQRRGLGSTLLDKASETLLERGATKVILGVGNHNLAVSAFYEKNGYKVMDDAVLFEKS